MTDSIIRSLAAGRSLASVSSGWRVVQAWKFSTTQIHSVSFKWALHFVASQVTQLDLRFSFESNRVPFVVWEICWIAHSHDQNSVFWDMLVIIAPLGLPPVLRWPLLVSSSQQLTDLVITNHNILWKSQRRVSDYLVTQRRMVVTFMPDQPAFSQPKTRQKFSWTPGKQLFANTTCGWLQAIFF